MKGMFYLWGEVHVCRVLVRKPEGKGQLARPESSWV